MDRLAAVITQEGGKTLADAKGDVLRGLQVAEAACAAPELLKGEVLEVAKDMETRTYREPLGVVAAICPFSKHHIDQLLLLTELQPANNPRLPLHDSAVDTPCCYHRWEYLNH